MRLFASDFDHTLYFHKEPHFKEKDLETIRKFQKEGNLFGVCTGRPKSSITIPSEGFVDYDFFICETGAYVTLKDGTVLVNEPIPFDVVKKLVNQYTDYMESIHSDYRYNLYLKESTLPLVRTIHNLNEIENEVIHQVSLRCADTTEAKCIAEEINARYPLNAFVNVTNIDIVSNRCDKGKGLEAVRNYYHSNIAFIGDSSNDLPGLLAADLSFTFHYSDKDVQKEADYLVDELNEAIELSRGIL